MNHKPGQLPAGAWARVLYVAWVSSSPSWHHNGYELDDGLGRPGYPEHRAQSCNGHLEGLSRHRRVQAQSSALGGYVLHLECKQSLRRHRLDGHVRLYAALSSVSWGWWCTHECTRHGALDAHRARAIQRALPLVCGPYGPAAELLAKCISVFCHLLSNGSWRLKSPAIRKKAWSFFDALGLAFGRAKRWHLLRKIPATRTESYCHFETIVPSVAGSSVQGKLSNYLHL